MKSRKSLIIFYDSKGNILIQDRRSHKPGYNDFGFFGGSMEEGETPEQALKREVMEELSITLKDFKLFKKIIAKDLDWNLFISPMPNLEEIECHEGKPVIVDINEALKMDFSERDKKEIESLRVYLSNNRTF